MSKSRKPDGQARYEANELKKDGKRRDAMRASPRVRQASAAEDAAMERWMSLKASKEASKADVDKAYKKYTTLARKRAETATATQTSFSKGGMVKKANCGASMKPTQKSSKGK